MNVRFLVAVMVSVAFAACGGGASPNPPIPAAGAARDSASNANDRSSGTCFAGGSGICTPAGDTITLNVPAGTSGSAGASVRYAKSSGGTVAAITALSLRYSVNSFSGSTPPPDIGLPPPPGSPRIDIPVVVDAGQFYDAFVEVNTCNDGGGFVDVINNPNCVITVHRGNNIELLYTGWAQYVANNANFVLDISATSHDGPYVIIDQPGTFTFSHFTFRTK